MGVECLQHDVCEQNSIESPLIWRMLMNLWTRLFRQESVKSDLDAEIESHLAMAAEEKQERGADHETARWLARQEFGNVALIKDVTHELSGWAWFERLGQDLHFAIRQICKNPGFSLSVILTLALGIGVNTTVFSMVNGFMLRPLPYPDADRIASLILHEEGVSPRTGQFGFDDNDSHTFETWNLFSRNLSTAQVAAQGGTTGVNLQAGSQPGAVVRYVHATRISTGYFDVLGIRPLLGRGFTADEDRTGGPKAVVLGYNLWQSAFDGDHKVLGKQITLKGEPYTVVGVLPSRTRTPGNGELFTALAPSAPNGECGGDNCSILLRLRTGATWQAADVEIARLRLPRFDQLSHAPRGRVWFYAQPLSRYLGGQMRTPVLALMLAVGFILFIACGNLAGLTLVRIARRTQEIATRLALGASRAAILRQLWVESLLLAILGAAVGLALAAGILAVIHGLVPDEFLPIGGLSIDTRVLAFTLGASLLTSLLFGALPAFQTRHVDLRLSFGSGSHAVSGAPNRIRQVLIAGEVCLTVVLLFSAGLLIRTLIHLETLPPGFDGHYVMTAKLSLDDARYHSPDAFRSFIDRCLEAMRRIPGVEDAAAGLSVPYERGLNDALRIVDGPFRGKQVGSSLAWVTPGYFRTLRIPVLAGRVLSDSDSSISEHVAVANTDFGRRFFQDPKPIGRHILSGKDLITIVGVVGNVAKRPGEYPDAPLSTEPVLYVPAAQAGPQLITMGNLWFQPSWIVRTRGPIPSLTSAMQHALAEADPSLPFAGFYAMSDILAESLVFQRIEVTLLAALAALALLLSAIGIYGLVSSLVLQRTREIGIRIALGSSIAEAMLKIGASGIAATACGLAGGFVFSFVAAHVLRSQLYGVRNHDSVTLLAVPAILGAIALVASFLPTLRITRIQPAETLRME
jgi:predicted permease